jgi:hypothetical protein
MIASLLRLGVRALSLSEYLRSTPFDRPARAHPRDMSPVTLRAPSTRPYAILTNPPKRQGD